MKLFSFIVFFILSLTGNTQNLAQNPDFELFNCSTCYLSSIENCSDWTSPTMSSPDYFNNSCLEYKTASVPQKYWGFQLPKSGYSYVGIIAYDFRKHNPEEAGAEYIQGRLSEPLKANEYYSIELNISLAECSKISLQNIGIYFSENEIKEKTVGLLKLKPQVISHINLSDTSKWATINETFTAKGNEHYFIIGCFDEGKKIKFRKVNTSKEIPDPRDYAYYFIDNIIIKPTVENIIVKTELPTIAKDIFEVQPVDFASSEKKVEVGNTFILKNISFTFGRSELAEVSFEELNKLVALMNNNPTIEINISGHTDNIGNKNDNMKLSKVRAEAVFNYLLSKGINKTRITFEGYGDTKPISGNETEDGRKINRRVEITITSK